MIFLRKQRGKGIDLKEVDDSEILNKLILIGVNRIDQRSIHSLLRSLSSLLIGGR